MTQDNGMDVNYLMIDQLVRQEEKITRLRRIIRKFTEAHIRNQRVSDEDFLEAKNELSKE